MCFFGGYFGVVILKSWELLGGDFVNRRGKKGVFIDVAYGVGSGKGVS